MSILFSQEEVTERYVYEQRMEARKEARKEERKNTALSMLQDKMAMDKIAKYTKLPLSRIRELAKSI